MQDDTFVCQNPACACELTGRKKGKMIPARLGYTCHRCKRRLCRGMSCDIAIDDGDGRSMAAEPMSVCQDCFFRKESKPI